MFLRPCQIAKGGKDHTYWSRVGTVMRTIERKCGRARRIWVFDRGIVSEKILTQRRTEAAFAATEALNSRAHQFRTEMQ